MSTKRASTPPSLFPAANDNFQTPPNSLPDARTVVVLVEWNITKNTVTRTTVTKTKGFLVRERNIAPDISDTRSEGIANTLAAMQLPNLLEKAPQDKALSISVQIIQSGHLSETLVATLPPNFSPDDIPIVTNKAYCEIKQRLMGGRRGAPTPLKGVS